MRGLAAIAAGLLLAGCAAAHPKPEPNGVHWLPAKVTRGVMLGGMSQGGMQGGGGSSSALAHLYVDSDDYLRMLNTTFLVGSDETLACIDTAACDSYIGHNVMQDAMVYVAGASVAGGHRFTGAARFGGNVTVDGVIGGATGLKLDTATARPTCDSTVRGLFWFTRGGAGVADTSSICRKGADDNYTWVAGP